MQIYKILSPFSSGHKEGILDILINPMSPLINQYYPQLQEYNRKIDQKIDQNSKLPNRPQESTVQNYALGKQFTKQQKLSRRNKYIRTMKRLQK